MSSQNLHIYSWTAIPLNHLFSQQSQTNFTLSICNKMSKFVNWIKSNGLNEPPNKNAAPLKQLQYYDKLLTAAHDELVVISFVYDTFQLIQLASVEIILRPPSSAPLRWGACPVRRLDDIHQSTHDKQSKLSLFDAFPIRRLDQPQQRCRIFNKGSDIATVMIFFASTSQLVGWFLSGRPNKSLLWRYPLGSIVCGSCSTTRSMIILGVY